MHPQSNTMPKPLKGPLSLVTTMMGRRKGIKMPAAMYVLPFILTLTNLHVQATTTATATETATGTLETSSVHATPMLSAAATILPTLTPATAATTTMPTSSTTTITTTTTLTNVATKNNNNNSSSSSSSSIDFDLITDTSNNTNINDNIPSH